MPTEKIVTVKALEDKLFLEEHVRVIFRLPSTCLVKDYPFVNQVSDSCFYASFQDRLERTYPDIGFIAIDGFGMPIERRGRKLAEIRESYAKTG